MPFRISLQRVTIKYFNFIAQNTIKRFARIFIAIDSNCYQFEQLIFFYVSLQFVTIGMQRDVSFENRRGSFQHPMTNE